MRIQLLMLAGVLSLVACLPLSDSSNSGNNIYVSNFAFNPVLDSGTADKNDTLVVTFRWADSATGIGHSIVWDSGPPPTPPNTGVIYSGFQTYILTPGRYFYHCGVHGENFGMYGVIDVIAFGTPTMSRLTDSRRSLPELVTRPSPAVVPERPRRAGRRSQPAAS